MTSWRRFLIAFVATFICALIVLSLPRYMNRLIGATLQAVGQDTTKAQPAPPAPLQQQQANAPVTPVTRSL
ncbi:MAG TPA: hypothetical protein VIV83_07360, partial [Gemmatimonadales bacterium]